MRPGQLERRLRERLTRSARPLAPDLASGYVVIVLANLDPPVAQRVADYLDARLPLDQ